MTDQEKVINRVRKLMKLANDGEASDGEIQNAMAAAAALIDKHNLDMESLTLDERAEAEQKMGQVNGKTESSKWHQWETTLAWAITNLFGTVQYYRSHEKTPIRVNGVVQTYSGKYAGKIKECRQVVFYGPLNDAQEAAELFTEWCHLIATMGVIRWGGAYRGEGEAYCQGFANQLYRQTQHLNEKRKLQAASAPLALPGKAAEHDPGKAITLRQRNEIIQNRASDWLRNVAGVKLSKRGGPGGSSSAGGNAYREGARHGAESGFGRAKQQKRLPG